MICTDPEWAVAGLTEDQARAAGHAPRVLRVDMAENDRAVAEADTAGSAALVIDRQDRLLGASLLAAHAGEAIGFWVQAIGRRMKLSSLAGTVLPYPTRAEAGRRAAGIRVGERLFAPGPRRLVRLLGWLP